MQTKQQLKIFLPVLFVASVGFLVCSVIAKDEETVKSLRQAGIILAPATFFALIPTAISFKRLELIELVQFIFYAVVLIQLVLINHVDLYIEDVSTLMRGHQSFICVSCYGILGCFGSADWMTHAIGRMLFMVLQTTIVSNKRIT